MKKTILFQLLFMLCLSAVAQQFETVKIDDHVSVSIPKGNLKKDTLGQNIISATGAFGNIFILKTPDDPSQTPDIEKAKHLDNYYSSYLKRIHASTKGIISEEKDTTIGKLHVKDFTLQIDSGTGKQIRDFRILHENNATYTFEFLYPEIQKEYAKADVQKFFNSINVVDDSSIKSQFTEPEDTTGKVPAGGNKLLLYGGIAAAIIIIIVALILAKRKRDRNL